MIHVGQITEMKQVQITDRHIEIGAAAPLTDCYAALAAEYPDFGDLLQRFASLVFSATVLSPAYPPAALWAGICLVALGSVGYLGAPGASPVGTRPFKVQEKKHL